MKHFVINYQNTHTFLQNLHAKFKVHPSQICNIYLFRNHISSLTLIGNEISIGISSILLVSLLWMIDLLSPKNNTQEGTQGLVDIQSDKTFSGQFHLP